MIRRTLSLLGGDLRRVVVGLLVAGADGLVPLARQFLILLRRSSAVVVDILLDLVFFVFEWDELRGRLVFVMEGVPGGEQDVRAAAFSDLVDGTIDQWVRKEPRGIGGEEVVDAASLVAIHDELRGVDSLVGVSFLVEAEIILVVDHLRNDEMLFFWLLLLADE